MNTIKRPGRIKFETEEEIAAARLAGDFWHKPAWMFFLVCFAISIIAAVLKISFPPLDGLVLFSACLSLLAGLGRRLPAQNIISAFLIITVVSLTLVSLGGLTGIPFGPFRHTERAGLEIVRAAPWFVPFLWTTVVLSGRGIARLIMRPWRKGGYYGFWVIGCTALLAVLFAASLEPYASAQQHYWLWATSPRVWSWYHSPWSNFLAWGLVTIGILVLGTPWFINKQPVKLPPDYHPLWIWLMLSALLALHHFQQQRWGALFAPLPFQAAAAWFAVSGARW